MHTKDKKWQTLFAAAIIALPLGLSGVSPAAAEGASEDYIVFNAPEVARDFPSTADTVVVDKRLVEQPTSGLRVERVYQTIPAHKHERTDVYNYLVSGRAKFAVGDQPAQEIGPGTTIFVKKGTVHSFPELIEGPLVFVTIETPPRDPSDVVFVGEGADKSFISTEQPK